MVEAKFLDHPVNLCSGAPGSAGPRRWRTSVTY